MVRLDKRVKRSHMTEREKTHTMGLVFLGVLLFVTGVLVAIAFHVWPNYPTFAVIGLCVLGTWCMAFPWGYIGAMEDERSGA